MFWSFISFFSVLLDWFDLRGLSDQEKDLEILILHHQLDIMYQLFPIEEAILETKPRFYVLNHAHIYAPDPIYAYHGCCGSV